MAPASPAIIIGVPLDPGGSRVQSAQKVMRNGAPDDAVFVADVALGSSGSLDAALEGADALIIATSAVPQVPSSSRSARRPQR